MDEKEFRVCSGSGHTIYSPNEATDRNICNHNGAMNLNPLLARILVLTWVCSLAACSKTVQWEEEVLLNTDETIVVKRSGTYSFKCEIAVGTGCGYSPEWHSTIEFTYKGKNYVHTSEAFPMVLAISPDGKPNLIAQANQSGWGNKNRYSCDAPYYVQFQPGENGKRWTWPNKIDTWLYDLPTNLVIGLPPLESNGKKLNELDREQENASIVKDFVFYRRIEPSYSSQHCVRSNSPPGLTANEQFESQQSACWSPPTLWQ